MVDSFLEYVFSSGKYSDEDKLSFLIQLMNSMFNGLLQDKTITTYRIKDNKLTFFNNNGNKDTDGILIAQLDIYNGGEYDPRALLQLYKKSGYKSSYESTCDTYEMEYLNNIVSIISRMGDSVLADLRRKFPVLYEEGNLLMLSAVRMAYRDLKKGEYRISELCPKDYKYSDKGILIIVDARGKGEINCDLDSVSLYWCDWKEGSYLNREERWAIDKLKDENEAVYSYDGVSLIRMKYENYIQLTFNLRNSDDADKFDYYLLLGKIDTSDDTMFGCDCLWLKVPKETVE